MDVQLSNPQSSQQMIPIFSEINYWICQKARSGALNMALDQVLLEHLQDVPLLRIYEWSQDTITYGYFQKEQDARSCFPEEGLNYVRRWTGGGIVDHRGDITYSLFVPSSHNFYKTPMPQSYQNIHKALMLAIGKLGEAAQLNTTEKQNASLACFTKPVLHDLTNQHGEKIAGAAQRRTRKGFLHQGSVKSKVTPAELGDALARELAGKILKYTPAEKLFQEAEQVAIKRYS